MDRADPRLNELAQRLDEIASQYEARFAGQPRHSRSLPALDRLISRTREVLGGFAALPPEAGTDGEALRALAEGNLRIYEAEPAAIALAQEAGADFEAAADLAMLANSVFARYHRHFAGLARATRDTGLLDEMIADLQAVEQGLSRHAQQDPRLAAQGDLQLVRDNLAFYRSERDAIAAAQEDGDPLGRAGVLASLASAQIQVYQDHFAGRSRLTRRPGLLQRLIATLQEVQARMQALSRAGVDVEWHGRNAEVVARNLRVFENELAEVRKLRQEAGPERLLAALGEEANAILDEYQAAFAGQDRAAVDVGRLGLLCDRMDEVARQYREALGAARGSEAAEIREDLEVAQRALSDFEREYELARRNRAQAQN